MVATSRKSLPYWQVIFPVGLLFAVICQLVATNCGIGMTNDSYMFLEGVAYFTGSSDLAIQDFGVFQAKPPLFSFFLSLLPLSHINLIYAFMLGISLFFWARIIDYLISNEVWKSLAFLSIASFTPLLMVHVYLWTEPLFMIFLVISVLMFLKIQQNFNMTYFVIFVLLGVLLILTRHVGVYFVAGFSLALFYCKNIKNKYLLVYLSFGLAVFFLWNFVLMQSGIESRLVTLKSPISGGSWQRLDNIGFYFGAVSKWLLPNSLPYWLRNLGLLAVLIILSNGFWKLRKSTMFGSIFSLVIVSASYYTLMHVAFKIDPFSAERYLMPIFPISAIIVFWTLEQLAKRNAYYQKYILIFSTIWLIYPIYRSVKNAHFWQDKLCNENKIAVQINKQVKPQNYERFNFSKKVNFATNLKIIKQN